MSENIIGKQYGTLKVIKNGSVITYNTRNKPQVICICSRCHIEREVFVHNLISGMTTGCAKCSKTSLTETEEKDIYVYRYGTSNLSCIKLAEMYGVTRHTIYNVLKREVLRRNKKEKDIR